MATNNELAAFEEFKFNVGQVVRLSAERIAVNMIANHVREFNARVDMQPLIGMVVTRWLFQDEAGISRAYTLNGMNLSNEMFKEFELEVIE